MMVPDHRAGTVLRCPNCGIDVQVPAAPGSVAKDAAKPRISTPVLAGKDAKPGLAAPNLAALSLSKPKTKLPVAAQAKPKVPVEPVSEEATEELATLEAVAQQAVAPEPVARDVEEIVPQPVAESVVAPLPLPTPAPATPEIVFTTPVVATPAPLATAPVVDQATIETVELPPKKPPLPREATATPAYAQQRDSERRSLEMSRKAAALESSYEINVPPPPPQVIDAEVLSEAPAAQPQVLSLHSAATVVDAQPPSPYEPAPPPLISLQGVQPTASQRHTTWQLAAALFAALLLSIGPSLWEFADYLRSDGEVTVAVARWAFLLLLLGMIQLGTIVLLIQVPDWSSVWIVTLQSLGLAALYAAILGLTVITGANSSLLESLNLDQQYDSGKAPPWCICLAATYACLAFFAGRFSAKWRKIHRQVEAAERAAAHA